MGLRGERGSPALGLSQVHSQERFPRFPHHLSRVLPALLAVFHLGCSSCQPWVGRAAQGGGPCLSGDVQGPQEE